jgi:hypothetical protein
LPNRQRVSPAEWPAVNPVFQEPFTGVWKIISLQ